MPRITNVNQVEYFVRAAEELSFSRAAEGLYVTQQAVSKAVGALEEELGARLFVRLSSGLELTDAGRVALDRGRALLAAARAMGDCAPTALASPSEGRQVRVAVSDVIVGNFVTLDALLGAGMLQDGVRLRIVEETSDRCLDAVAGGSADLGVVVGRGVGADLLAREVLREEFVPFASARHPLASRETVGVDEVARERFLLPRGSSESVDAVREALFDAGAVMPVREAFSAPACSPRTLIGLVCSQDDAIGMIARRAASLVGAASGVVLRTPPGLVRMPLALVMRASSRGDETLAAIGERLVAALRAGGASG
ncbi:LysR family transcriptional regulator [bacterium]|nr:LysR family transcriptional regulator [bacterium]